MHGNNNTMGIHGIFHSKPVSSTISSTNFFCASTHFSRIQKLWSEAPTMWSRGIIIAGLLKTLGAWPGSNLAYQKHSSLCQSMSYVYGGAIATNTARRSCHPKQMSQNHLSVMWVSSQCSGLHIVLRVWEASLWYFNWTVGSGPKTRKFTSSLSGLTHFIPDQQEISSTTV